MENLESLKKESLREVKELEFTREIESILSGKAGNSLKILTREIKDILVSKKLELKVISYFSIIITLLSQEENSVKVKQELLYLLNLNFKYLSREVILKKFIDISEILEKQNVSKVLVDVYSQILGEITQKDLRVKKVVNKFLEFSKNSNIEIRKKAIREIIKIRENYTKEILEFLFCNLKDKSAVFILEFLKEVLQHVEFKEKDIVKITAELLDLPGKIKEISVLKLVYQNLCLIIQSSNLLKLVEFSDLEGIKPFYNDVVLVPEYLRVMEMYFKQISQKEIYNFFIGNFKVFDSKSSCKTLVKKSTAETLGNIILHAMVTISKKEFQEYILDTLNESLESLNFRESWGYILMIYQAVFVRLGGEDPEMCKSGLIKLFGFRDNHYSNFPYKEQLEACLISAVQSLGIDYVLTAVPLNILQEHPGEPTRPYFLATLEKAMSGSQLDSSCVPFSFFGRHSLKFFHEHLFQLATKLFEKAEALCLGGKDLEAKLYETLGLQAMHLMPLIAKTRPVDFEIGLEMLSPTLGHILQSDPASLYPNLPSHPDFRPLACETLQKLIRAYVELVAELEEEDSEELNHAANGLIKAKEYTNQFLSILCNLYTSISPDILENPTKGVALQSLHQSQSQYVEKTISTFLEIAEKADVKSYFTSMLNLLQETQSRLKKDKSSISHEHQLEMLRFYAVLELLLLMLEYLPSDDVSPVQKHFELVIGLLKDKDSTAQKKAYKSLVSLLEYIPLDLNTFDALTVELLDDEVVSSVHAGSKKARIQCISRLTEKVPSSNSAWLLKWIPMCLSEVMLATKESSEKARSAAYECLVAMGHRMMDSKIDRLSGNSALSSADQMDEDGDSLTPRGLTSENGITEFFTMVSAGLAGTTPHFQSATIGSISRLFFEFHTCLHETFIESIIQTICSMLTSKSREILKSLLGFIKVLISSVSPTVIKLYLKDIVSKLGIEK
jgi:hypothetical protein